MNIDGDKYVVEEDQTKKTSISAKCLYFMFYSTDFYGMYCVYSRDKSIYKRIFCLWN